MEKEYEQQTKYKRTRTEGEKWGKGKDNTRGRFVAARQNYPRIFFLFHVNLSTPFPRNWLYWLEIFVSLFISPQSSLSLQFSHLVMSNSLWPHGLQHARLPCQSPAPRTCSNSCPLSWWCHPTVSSSVVPFSSCLQSFPVSGSFPMSQFFTWPKYWSFSFSISPSNEYSGLISCRMDWLNLLAVQGTLKSLF